MPHDELMRRLWIRVGIYACLGCLVIGLVTIAVGGWGIAILATIAPYTLIAVTTWLEQSPRLPSLEEISSMYVFFLSYSAILSVLLLALANAGLCLRKGQ